MNTTVQTDRYAIARNNRQRHVDAVVDATTDKKLVVAGPGTGKTYLFKTVLDGKSKALTLTFVNALVADLSLELYGLSEVKTLHAFARSQLNRARDTSVRVFPKLSKVITEDAMILLGDKIDFNHIFHNREDVDCRLEFYKKRKDYYGHYGFPDLVYATVLLFEHHEDKIPAYEQVVVDEFQDFNTLEVSLIDLLAKKSPVLLAGDDDQALYGSLKSASAKYIRERHAEGAAGYTSFDLPYCSRSTRVIVEATNNIIARAKDEGLLSGRIDKPFQYFEDPDKDKESDDNPQIIHSSLYERQIAWFIQKRVKEITKQIRKKFTVLILSPTRRKCGDVHEALKSKGFENVKFTAKTDSAEPSLLDGLKLLLEDRTCNLGWRVVSRILLDDTDFGALLRRTDGNGEPEKFPGMIDRGLKKQVSCMLKTLRSVRDGKELADDQLSELLLKVKIDAYGAAAQTLRDKLTPIRSGPEDPGIKRTSIEITTIQSSKGLAADYVFITHFDDRFFVRGKDKRRPSDQDVCSFIVALTRARRKVFLLSSTRYGQMLWIGFD